MTLTSIILAIIPLSILFNPQFLPVEEQIRLIAREQNFEQEEYLVRLAFCESSFRPLVTQTNKSGSVDRGIFQINSRWHKEVSDECAFSIPCSTKWTIKRLQAGYSYEWVCSQKIN